MQCFATCPSGFSDLLEQELVACGAEIRARTATGIGFSGTLEVAYRACLWSRVANRVLLKLGEFPADHGDSLYAGARCIDWRDVIAEGQTFAVEFTSRASGLTHTLFGAQRVKDAIVDQWRDAGRARPDVDVRNRDVPIHVHVEHDVATAYFDLVGESLHRRGYRTHGGTAPLKENLAAGLLLRAGWPAIAADGGALVDPMCGSGTFLIEGLLMAADVAPGLDRAFAFERWQHHDAPLAHALAAEAHERKVAGLARFVAPVTGSDSDPRAVAQARGNVDHAGFAGRIAISERTLSAVSAPAARGLVIANPPYGERLEADLPALYTEIGELLKSQFQGWRAAIVAPDAELGFRIGLRVKKKNKARNGPLEVVLLTYDVLPSRMLKPRAHDPGIDAFINRLRKNAQHLKRWAGREGITCYRLYDADLPDYAFAIDRYEGDRVHLHVQEYAPPAQVDEKRAAHRRESLLAVLPAAMGVDAADVQLKTRMKQRGRSQYVRQDDSDEFFEVQEGGCRLLVNLRDYLDTGLFLDHRPLRMRIQAESSGKRFLNLFAYTASATVHAVRGGAISSTSVDLSNTYLDWARRNLVLNGVDLERHRLARADCRDWLALAAKRKLEFDLILLDPPSFSNSKGRAGEFVVQRDHAALIRDCCAVLANDGALYFSTNLRKFRLDRAALTSLAIDDISASTIDEDFKRNPQIHTCFRIRRGDWQRQSHLHAE